jgi:hypothetical protein
MFLFLLLEAAIRIPAPDRQPARSPAAQGERCGKQIEGLQIRQIYWRTGPHMGSTQYLPLSSFSWPFFTAFFVSFFLMAVSSFAAFRYVRR